MAITADRDTILDLTQKLLTSISRGDWETYKDLCCSSLSCFEPEALGNLVEGLDFHQYYFNLPSSSTQVQSTIASPHIRVMGDVALIAYIRLTQKMVDGRPITVAMEETRIWQKQNSKWKHIHFHRSPAQ